MGGLQNEYPLCSCENVKNVEPPFIYSDIKNGIVQNRPPNVNRTTLAKAEPQKYIAKSIR